MKFIRTISWMLVAIACTLIAAQNWEADVDRVTGRILLKLWGTIGVDARLPVLLMTFLLAGAVPMWLYHRAVRWRLERRIAGLENSVRAAEPPATDPLLPAPVTLEKATLDQKGQP